MDPGMWVRRVVVGSELNQLSQNFDRGWLNDVYEVHMGISNESSRGSEPALDTYATQRVLKL